MSTPTAAPSLFENFNARNLSAIDVARTFVPSPAYSRLLAKNHTLVVGPRGSGKTTLLKMCQQQALDSWNREDADAFRKKVDFVGVLVPTDVSWGRQIQSLGTNDLSPPERELFGIAAFTTNVLRALAGTMEHRAAHRPKARPTAQLIGAQSEAAVVRGICEAWLLPPRFSTLRSLKHSLSQRLSVIHVLANRVAHQSPEERKQTIVDSLYLHLSLLNAAVPAVEQFNDAVDEPDARWAFLFDELELAPKAIVDTLIGSLRSVDERFLFKLSIAPFSEDVTQLQHALSATPGNDYTVIPLWFSHKEDSKPFCRELWKSLLASGALPFEEPEEVLGTSPLTTLADEWSESQFATAYRPGSKHAKRMKSLKAKDESFRHFLDSHHIDVDELQHIVGDDRAQTVRKAVALVALRDALRDAEGRLRSRKLVSLYSGADALFAIVEGNPRWFKGIIGELLRNRDTRRSERIKPERQAHQIAKAVNRFYALLRTIPMPPTSSVESRQSLPSLLDSIGDYFFHAQVLAPFTVDPPGRFKVNRQAHPGLVQSLGQALNAGAIVSMSESDDHAAGHKIRDEEFRLSYLLAAHYKLMLRTGRAVSLQTILTARPLQPIATLFQDEDDDID